MGEPLRRDEEVINMVQYMRDSLARMDQAVEAWMTERNELAVRLAAMESAHDPKVLAAAEDYQRRIAEERPYEDAEDAETLIGEAHRRFVP